MCGCNKVKKPSPPTVSGAYKNHVVAPRPARAPRAPMVITGQRSRSTNG